MRRALRAAGPLPVVVLLALVAGVAIPHLVGAGAHLRQWIWMAGLVITGAPVIWRTTRGALRGRFAADLVASLAIFAAILLVQPLAGLVVVLMQTGGEALERYAEGRASDAVRALEESAPQIARLVTSAGIRDVPADSVVPGDLLLVRPGDMLPCDSVVVSGHSHVDESLITGEPIPRRATHGARLLSGSLNKEGVLRVSVIAPARESQYARIVRLVRTAQASKAPLQRLADRYAVWFTPLTLFVCVVAYAISGDPVRVLAVLVVATPCPLILAAPVAVVGGIDQAARRGIVFRTGGALERLASADAAVFDKTGTLTVGRPEVTEVIPLDGFPRSQLLRLVGGAEQASGHPMARSIVAAAEAEVGELPEATDAREAPGRGITASVSGRVVTAGGGSFLAEEHGLFEEQFRDAWRDTDGDEPDDGLRALVAVDGQPAGVIRFADRMRPEVDRLFERLQSLGIRRTVLLSGDRSEVAVRVGKLAGAGEVLGDLLPEGKAEFVREMQSSGDRVVMVGDGTNDAPALSTATVGVALGTHGTGIATESADVVLLADDVSRVADAIGIARRTFRIARQSIVAGIGLSFVAMLFAAAGQIPPTVGALLQEGIDVAVILNALRASRGA